MIDDIDYQILTRRMLDFEDKLKQLEEDVDAFGKELDKLALEFYKEEVCSPSSSTVTTISFDKPIDCVFDVGELNIIARRTNDRQ